MYLHWIFLAVAKGPVKMKTVCQVHEPKLLNDVLIELFKGELFRFPNFKLDQVIPF